MESQDIGQNVSNFAGLVWKADFLHLMSNISGLEAYFSKPIFALEPWVQANWFEYHEPYNPIDIFFTYKGIREILRVPPPELENLKILKIKFFLFLYTMEQ